MARGSPDWQPWVALQRFSETGGATPFEQKVSVAAGTAEGSATLTDIELCKGFVAHVWIRFPSGPAGLMHVGIYDPDAGVAAKIWPGVTAQWFSGDNEIIEFNTEYDVPDIAGTYKLQVQAWNEDDTYGHSVLVRIWVVEIP